ncbi:hypothetical protein [Salsuginibacillus kocurii]|uniref:hypothetical protein n=1 Tax=Salsuginibacillus kocurii TaxID=427078 RepID=UPI0012EAE081|nr:hypothetical protein [Salsuginibacillus kocurii]
MSNMKNWCEQHLGQMVTAQMNDNSVHQGMVEHVDDEYIYLMVPEDFDPEDFDFANFEGQGQFHPEMMSMNWDNNYQMMPPYANNNNNNQWPWDNNFNNNNQLPWDNNNFYPPMVGGTDRQFGIGYGGYPYYGSPYYGGYYPYTPWRRLALPLAALVALSALPGIW